MSTAFHLIVGDGVIGQAVAANLAARGLACQLASRGGPKSGSPAPCPRIALDALDREAFVQAAQGASHLHLTLGLPYDTAVWQRDWPRVMDNAIAAALTQEAVLVFFDNIYAYGTGDPQRELENPIAEEHPRHPPSRKGAIRLGLLGQIERAAAERGLRWVIARCADFYGPGAVNSMLLATGIARQLQGKGAQWLGDPELPHSLTYTDDAARAQVQLALDPGAWQQAWHLPTAAWGEAPQAMGPAPTPRQLLAHSARLIGAPETVAAMPAALLWVLKRFVPILREVDEMLYQNRQAYVFSSARFMQRYPDFRLTPYPEGLAAMVEAARKTKRA
jgi:nucleoside-diphosphate-sugar epimerase